MIGSSGGRLDHLLGSLLLLGDERYAGAEIDAWLGASRVHVVRGSRTLAGAPGELVSLLPLHGAAEGVTTEGLEYPLRGETLPAGHEPRDLERLQRRGGPHHRRARLPAGRAPRPAEGGDPCDDLAQGRVRALVARARCRRGGVRRLATTATARRSCSSRTTRSRSRSR